jgi:CHASE2 domain-containing sensor protein/signal transduction histidine kinase
VTRAGRLLLSGLAATLLLVVIELFGLFEGLNLYAYDLFLRIRGPREPSEKVVLVAIDDKTLQRLGRWPIGRSWYPELLDRLGSPAVVGLNVIFSDPSPEDEALAQGLGRYPNVVLPAYLDPQRGWVEPRATLGAHRVGHIHLEPGVDGVARQVFHEITHRGTRLPSFASAMKFILDGKGSLERASPALPEPSTDIIQTAPMWINYYGGRGALRTLSFVDVLDGKWSPAFFDGRAVLVGLTAAGLEEGALTPLSPERKRLSGVEAHGQILLNLLDGSDIRPLRGWLLWTTMLLAAFVSFWWMERRDPLGMLLVLLGGIALALSFSYAALALASLWIPPAGYLGLMGTACVAGYVSRMRQMHELLRQAGKDWEESFHSLDEAIILYDRSCRIVRMNRAASQDLGAELLEMLRERCHYWVLGKGGHERDGARDEWSARWSPGAEEVSVSHGDRQYELRSLPRVDENGGFHGFIHVVRDVTYRRRLETEQRDLQARLAQAQKMEALGTLAGGIAHDFNNILSAIIGYAELIEASTGGEYRVHEKLARITQAGMRARDLVKQILTFSRRTARDLKPVQPGLIVEESMRLMRPALPSTIEIRCRVASEAFVEGDETQIQQIVMNLCTNAYQSMKTGGGLLEVSVEDALLSNGIEQDNWLLPPGRYVAVRVRDTGHGIPEEIRKRIFEPYFTTKEVGEGTGLGLSTVHGILKAHGGGLYLESEVGRGTTFHVYLPTLDRVVPPAERRKSGGSPRGSEHILFVDDEAALVDIAREALVELGYRVTAMTSPVDALECLRRDASSFDVLITDLTMPRVTGIQLAAEARRIRADLPVILCTGYRQVAKPEDIEAAGIGCIVPKPATSRDLAEAVRCLVGRPGREGRPF